MHRSTQARSIDSIGSAAYNPSIGHNANVRCDCGLQLEELTSWTKYNPGRRFYACPKVVRGCGFFVWSDPPMCRRSKQIIPGLLKKRNAHERKIWWLQLMCKILVVALVLSWIFFFLYWWTKSNRNQRDGARSIGWQQETKWM